MQEKSSRLFWKIKLTTCKGVRTRMKKINLKGITAEAVINIALLALALINAVLQMFGINTLPIEDTDISAIISGVFVVVTALYNTWKNRNLSTASQIAQEVTDAIKNGEILADDIKMAIDKCKNRD